MFGLLLVLSLLPFICLIPILRTSLFLLWEWIKRCRWMVVCPICCACFDSLNECSEHYRRVGRTCSRSDFDSNCLFHHSGNDQKRVGIHKNVFGHGCRRMFGFLTFNAYPARIFMGDTGSLALGGAVGAIAILMKMPLILLIVGGIYVVEALSVMIQVLSFKLTGKRVFKMAPIHHHFELSGWKEVKVVLVFWTITVLLCILGFFALRLKFY